MVQRSPGACQTAGWHRDLALAFRAVGPLLDSLGLRPDQVPDLDPQPHPFRLLVPRGFAALMARGDPWDPLLRQVLPLGVEGTLTPGFLLDPVGDRAATRVPGLLQKYQGRTLLMAHGACAVHCRYCFRRHFPYPDMGGYAVRTASALDAIQGDPSLMEVILSGGDPLLLEDGPLADLIQRLAAIPHLRRVRVHSRLPVVLPSRVTEQLCELLVATRLKPVLVIHANHVRELGGPARSALAALCRAGVTLLNQSVLLRGINDSVCALVALSEGLFDSGVLPYYLHQLDPVQGSAHFSVADAEALPLMETLRARLPGYLVPRLVRDIAGEASKTPLG